MSGASTETAKELKALGFGPYVLGQYTTLAKQMLQQSRRLAAQHFFVGSALDLVATAGYYGAYAVVVTRALTGAISIGAFTFLIRTLYRVQAHVDRIFGSPASTYLGRNNSIFAVTRQAWL